MLIQILRKSCVLFHKFRCTFFLLQKCVKHNTFTTSLHFIFLNLNEFTFKAIQTSLTNRLCRIVKTIIKV